ALRGRIAVLILVDRADGRLLNGRRHGKVGLANRKVDGVLHRSGQVEHLADARAVEMPHAIRDPGMVHGWSIQRAGEGHRANWRRRESLYSAYSTASRTSESGRSELLRIVSSRPAATRASGTGARSANQMRPQSSAASGAECSRIVACSCW